MNFKDEKIKCLLKCSFVLAFSLFWLVAICCNNFFNINDLCLKIMLVRNSVSFFTLVILSGNAIFSLFWIFTYWLLNNHLWKISWINKLLGMGINTPILLGRWEGSLDRTNEESKETDDEHIDDFVLEIKQSFISVSCQTFANNKANKKGKSSSTYAELLYDGHQKAFTLYYIWKGDDNTIEGGERFFDGTTKLTVLNGNKTLDGEYYTNRNPYQTKGTLLLHHKHKECYGTHDVNKK